MWANDPKMAQKWSDDTHTSKKNHRMPDRNGPGVHSRKKTRGSKRAKRK